MCFNDEASRDAHLTCKEVTTFNTLSGAPLCGACLQPRDFGFQLGDTSIALSQRCSHICGIQSLRDVLRAVCIPRQHVYENDALNPRFVADALKARIEICIVFDHTGVSPDLDPLSIGVVDQKEMSLRIVTKITDRNVLPVAGEVGKSDGLVAEHAQESRRAAPVLKML